MLKVAAVFSDHMVLQRGKRIAVFGNSDKKSVTVSLKMGEEISVSGNVKKNEFYVELPPQKAGGPYEMKVSDGDEEVIFSDVMIGEVWLAGGQSNMEFELQNCKNGKETVENAVPGKVRFYYTPKVAWKGKELAEAEACNSWTLFTPKTCKNWSGVGYFFAKEIADKLGVTVGIIGCNWGGTSASCWMSREAIEEQKCLASYLNEYDSAMEGIDEETHIKQYEEYIAYQSRFDENVNAYYKNHENPTWAEAISLYGESRYPGPLGPHNFTRPCGLYETMLKRVMPYSLAGFLFYQGEEDDHKPFLYETLLRTLILEWRRGWKDDNLPFLMVQLPVFRNEGEDDYCNWPFIREAQMKLAMTMRHVEFAVALELGEEINIHPTNKQPVGQRLAKQALAKVYDIAYEKEANAPTFTDYYVINHEMVLLFDYARDGFVVGKEEYPFEIAGEDGVYYKATARFEGERVILSAPEVEKPCYARYFWKNYGEHFVFGKNGLPLVPFRTSDRDGALPNGSRQGRIFLEKMR